MIKLISKDNDGNRLCFMTLAEIYKYIYKPDKEKKKLTYADIQLSLEERGILPVAIDEKGVSYYKAYERYGRYLLAP